MAKKERLGSDPFKESPLNWIQDTREEKKDSKDLKTQKVKELKPQSVLTSKRLNAKTLKRQNVKASKQDVTKKTELKRKHTIYLSSGQSKKLKIYAAENNMKLRNNIIKNRLIGNGGIEELIITLCRLILPIGYDKIIFKKIKPDLDHNQ